MDNSPRWIEWFLQQPRGKFFVRISEEYISNSFNYYGIRQKVNTFSAALELILKSYVQPVHADMTLASQAVVVEQQAETLYGLLHARYILTEEGLQKMYEKYKSGDFPKCPRKLCNHFQCVPYGISNDMNEYPVTIFCPCCKEVYNINNAEFQKVDGAFFGNSWVHIFLAKYHELFDGLEAKKPTPTIYGFRISQVQYNDEEEDMTS